MLALLLSQVIPTEWALLQAIVGGLITVMLYASTRQLRWRVVSGITVGRPLAANGFADQLFFDYWPLRLVVVTFFALRGKGRDPPEG